MKPVLDASQVVRALGALAQEHRLAAYRLLIQAGANGMAAGAIAGDLGVAPSSMSFHLATLAHAGLVRQNRQGRSIRYFADYPAMAGVMGYLTENCCGGVPCMTPPFCVEADDGDRPGCAGGSVA